LRGLADEADPHPRFVRQRIEVVEVADLRQADHRDVEDGRPVGGFGVRAAIERDRVLLG
jgi:hypothetical protein